MNVAPKISEQESKYPADGLVNRVNFSPEELGNYNRDGFLRIKKIFSDDAVNGIRDVAERLIEQDKLNTDGTLSRVAFRLHEDPHMQNIINHQEFADVFRDLIGDRLIFTEAQAFELSKGGTGLPWHFGYISFGYIRTEDMGYTLWVPLSPVVADKTGGGMAYVSTSKYSADRDFNMGSLLAKRMNAGEDMSELLDGFKQAHTAMEPILEENCVEDDFDVGDAFLFNKHVWHRSSRFLAENATRRLGVAFRFIDLDSHLDMERWKAEFAFGGGLSTGHKKYVYSAKEDRFSRFTDIKDGEPIRFSKQVKKVL